MCVCSEAIILAHGRTRTKADKRVIPADAKERPRRLTSLTFLPRQQLALMWEKWNRYPMVSVEKENAMYPVAG